MAQRAHSDSRNFQANDLPDLEHYTLAGAVGVTLVTEDKPLLHTIKRITWKPVRAVTVRGFLEELRTRDEQWR